MRAFVSMSISELVSLSRKVWSNSSTRLCIAGTVPLTRTRFDEPFSSKVVPSDLSATEKEEVRTILNSFLENRGFTSVLRTVKSDLFIDHLTSRLHSVHKSRQLVGHELTAVDIKEVLVPYLESLSEQHGDNLLDLVKNFPDPLDRVKSVVPVSPSHAGLHLKRLKALSRLDKKYLDGQLPPTILYLLELGLEFEQIRKMTMKSISFPYCSLDAKLKPLLEFLLDLGISKSNVLTVLIRFPQVVGFSLKENIIPTMLFLQNFGLKKSLWGKTICRCPSILGLREQKIRKNIDFLLGVGVLPNDIGKILTRFPIIISLSVEHKLLPAVQYFCSLGVDEKNIGRMLTRYPFIIGFSVEGNLPSKVEYFRSFGIDVGYFILHNPQAFALGIESNLVHVTTFFSGKGYTKEEIGIMISKHGSLCCYSLIENVIPKWEFYLTMGYSREELVRFPHYFSYSLEGRIKPRYALLKESGAQMGLTGMLTLTEDSFVKAVKKKVEDSISGGDSRGARNSSRLS